MPETEENQNKEEIIAKADLKPGYVLFENLFDKVGMRAGHVLSADDIENILNHSGIDELRILKSLSSPDDELLKSYKAPTLEDLADIEISGPSKVNSMVNPTNEKKLSRIVNMKKEIIRGEDYKENVARHKEEKLKEYEAALKEIHSQQKAETLKVIDDYAVSAADMDSIEKIESNSAPEILHKLNKYEKNGGIFLDHVINQKKVFSAFVEEVVVDFLNDVGYELPRALLASVVKAEAFMDYISSHSIQVMVVALITAIEMTKMVKEKSDNTASTDLNTFLAVSDKFFSLEDLVNLGVAALLHDVEFKNKYPNYHLGDETGYSWESIMALHPSNGFHICKKINIDYDVQRAVYQHHERFDGSGYPNGLFPRFFSKYTPVLMFAEYYVELTTINPFQSELMPPRDALVHLLAHERNLFDGDVIYAFIRSASLFPVGSWLLLDDGHIGIVTDVNKNKLERPVMKMFFDKNTDRVKPFEIDLLNSDLKIVKPIDIYSIRKMAGEAMSFIFGDS